MSRISALFAFEALLCGGPVTVTALYGLPWLVLGPLRMLDQSPLAAAKSILWLLGCLLALLAFWRLAISTATNQKFSFNVVFWLGVVGAGFALVEVSTWAEGPLFMAGFIAPAICALHFVYIQHRKANK